MPPTIRLDSPLLIAGVAITLGSVAAAAWMLHLGDVVTALGLSLFVAAGLLLAGIDLSSETALP
ncbi:MAG: hypothetical protein ABEJ73_12890 [Haloplanus sp.]